MATTLIAVLKSTCYDYFPVSQICYSLFLYGLIDLIFESFPFRNGVRVRRERVCTQLGVIASVRVRTMGQGVTFFRYGAYLLIERPQNIKLKYLMKYVVLP